MDWTLVCVEVSRLGWRLGEERDSRSRFAYPNENLWSSLS